MFAFTGPHAVLIQVRGIADNGDEINCLITLKLSLTRETASASSPSPQIRSDDRPSKRHRRSAFTRCQRCCLFAHLQRWIRHHAQCPDQRGRHVCRQDGAGEGYRHTASPSAAASSPGAARPPSSNCFSTPARPRTLATLEGHRIGLLRPSNWTTSSRRSNASTRSTHAWRWLACKPRKRQNSNWNLNAWKGDGTASCTMMVKDTTPA